MIYVIQHDTTGLNFLPNFFYAEMAELNAKWAMDESWMAIHEAWNSGGISMRCFGKMWIRE